MAIISQIMATIGGLAVSVTQAVGYPGVAILMALESTAVPLPSELVLPFAGYLSATGQFNIWLVWLAATLGSWIGSLASYYMGFYGGEIFVRKLGKYVFLDEADLNLTERWFQKRGDCMIFFARFVPVVRHLISIPAGVGKMDLKKFSFYTVAGAGIWNLILIWLGYYLGANWRTIRNYSEYFSIAVAGLLVIAFIIFIVRHLKHKQVKK